MQLDSEEKKQGNLMVFIVTHVREDERYEDDFKMIGVFSTLDTANDAVLQLLEMPGFVDYKGGFSVDEYLVDELSWEEGFSLEAPE